MIRRALKRALGVVTLPAACVVAAALALSGMLDDPPRCPACDRRDYAPREGCMCGHGRWP